MKQGTETGQALPRNQPGWRRWLGSRKRWQRRFLYAILVVLCLSLLHIILEQSFTKVENPRYGVSFSTKYAQELGVDWRKNFTALLDDMGIRRFRLMSYWDLLEAEKGQLDFTDLDWQMDEAHKRGATVSLVVGLRQPRWPECHQPSWYSGLSSKERETALFNFVEAVVQRYSHHPALQSYQLENEALNRHFGTCQAADIDQARLKRQFQFVTKLDPNHPVYMSLSDQHGLPLGSPVPDKYGFSVYRTVWNEKFGPIHSYVTYPTPIWYHRLRAWWIRTFKDRDIFIHELQLEPWGPRATKDLSMEEQNKSMSIDQISANLSFARKIGARDIDLWGGEWWYWRKTVHNDPSIWNAVKQELSK